MKAVVYTLGCKVNRTESEGLMAELSSRGFSVFDTFCPADLYIINTCAVTADAEKKSRQAVSKAAALNPNAKIIVTGCSSQNDYKKYKNVSLITGTAGKHKLAELLTQSGVKIEELPREFEEAKTSAAHTRAFIKIQDGCDNFCSYCIVPYLRGASRSRKTEKILEDIVAQKSVKEIVLTGINISKYGLDSGSSLTSLLKTLKDTELRLRLGSLEVGIIDKELLSALKAIKNFCPHFHLSLQSCNDTVLKNMNRHYSVRDIFEAVRLIRTDFPEAGITADIIAGFPEETEEQHNNTKNNLELLALSYIHIFPYSVRLGTKAAEMKDLPFETKKRRAEELGKVKEFSREKFLSQQIGEIEEILTEKGSSGLTKNYVRVYYKDDKIKQNEIIAVKTTELYRDGVKGEIV